MKYHNFPNPEYEEKSRRIELYFTEDATIFS